MPKRPLSLFLLAASLCLGSTLTVLPAAADALPETETAPAPAESPDATPAENLEELPLEPDEDPELPPEMLVLPDDDPAFAPDGNTRPIEDDWLRMPPGQNPLYWRLELREQFGGTSNVDQLAGGAGSLTNQATLTGLLRYTFPSQTQVLLRSQGFLFNRFNLDQRDQFLAIPLSLNVSQWFFDRLNIYAGYLPIFSRSLNRQDGQIQRFDQDFMLGASYFYPLDEHYVFGGLQADYMLAELSEFQYLSGLLFAGYRHTLAPNLFGFVDARLQTRGYTSSPELLDEIRFGGGAAVQWHLLPPWLILEARGDYNQVVHFTAAERNAGIFSIGLNLIAALQSDS